MRILVGLMVLAGVAHAATTPRHVMLTYARDANGHASSTSMIVTYATDIINSPEELENYKALVDTNVRWGTTAASLTQTAVGTSSNFANEAYRSQIHEAVMTGLTPDTKYFYQVGADAGGWSPVHSFTTKSRDLTYAIYGDFGYVNSRITDQLNLQVGKVFDAVIHIGDMAYNLDTQMGVYGDKFLDQIETVTTQVPYVTVPGNHEAASNFSHYKARFGGVTSGLGKSTGNNLWYSWNQGLIHWLAFDTEVYTYSPDSHQQRNQIDFIRNDLIEANKNRAAQPWIIAYAHKASWMENTNFSEILPLLHSHGVDILLAGHVHNYARLLPFHGKVVDEQVDKKKYVNAKYLTQIVTGSPGCQEGVSPITSCGPIKEACAEVSKDYGFARLHVVNATHLHWQWELVANSAEQVKTGQFVVHDDFWFVQNHHGPRA
jgi:predicted phosphodiesterase